MGKNNNIFFELLKAGLWEKNVQHLLYEEIDFSEILKVAKEQSVVGLVTIGIDKLQESWLKSHTTPMMPEIEALKFIGRRIKMEHRNEEMNHFISITVDKMREVGIELILVKGQGLSQCYDQPLLRSCGDVDFFLNNDNYEKAKAFLSPFASDVETEYKESKHLGMTIEGWTVELHGSLRGGISNKINKVMDEIQTETFEINETDGRLKNVRVWQNNGTDVYLMKVENDVVYVFVHFLSHFFKEGVGLRQICDWCRLLWTYREELDVNVVESRIHQMGLMSEWKAFGAYAVNYLGMPIEAMPILSRSEIDTRMEKKVERINKFILSVGNMGKNRDMSYLHKYPFLIRKYCSMKRRIADVITHSMIFPLDSLRFLPKILISGMRSAINGEG